MADEPLQGAHQAVGHINKQFARWEARERGGWRYLARDRREFITLLGGAVSVFLCVSAAAQEGYYGVGHDKWHQGFYSKLKRNDGQGSCCNLMDCRPTQSRMVGDHPPVKDPCQAPPRATRKKFIPRGSTWGWDAPASGADNIGVCAAERTALVVVVERPRRRAATPSRKTPRRCSKKFQTPLLLSPPTLLKCLRSSHSTPARLCSALPLGHRR